MELARTLWTDSKREHWVDGGTWFFWAILGGLLPIWITTLILWLTKQEVGLSGFVGNGEFALYAASFLSGSIYLVQKDYKSLSYPSRKTLLSLLIVALLFCGVMYSTVYMIHFFSTIQAIPFKIQRIIAGFLHEDRIRLISLWILPPTMIMAAVIVVGDHCRTTPDFIKRNSAGLRKLLEDFDGL